MKEARRAVRGSDKQLSEMEKETEMREVGEDGKGRRGRWRNARWATVKRSRL